MVETRIEFPNNVKPIEALDKISILYFLFIFNLLLFLISIYRQNSDIWGRENSKDTRYYKTKSPWGASYSNIVFNKLFLSGCTHSACCLIDCFTLSYF